jgi:palmitoyl-protein thioesterase
MHGLGDSGTNPGMQSLCKTFSSTYPGMYAVCAAVSDGSDSFFQLLDTQVDEFAKLVQADPKLSKGFSAVGLSQGNLVIRGYVEKYNNPPVKTFVSICGPHSGVGACPTLLGEIVCPLWKLAPYSAHLAFSG